MTKADLTEQLYQALNQQKVNRVDSFVTDRSMRGVDVKNNLQSRIEKQEKNIANAA